MVKSDNAAGVTAAVASPWATRAAIRTHGVVGQPADQGRDPQDGHAHQEQSLASEQVRDPTEEQSEAGRAQSEARGYPLKVGQREPDVGTDGG